VHRQAPGFPVTLSDDNGVRITLRSPPQRIVTFAPSMTEIVFALGEGSRVVGVSGPADDYPPAARRVERIGAGEFGTEPNIEKVVSLHPDLFLYAFTGKAEWMDRLRSLGIPVFTALSTSFPDLLHDIRTVGELTGVPGAADRLTARMRNGAASIQRSVSALPSVPCFFEEGYGPPIYTVGPGSFIFDLLRRAGCAPVTAGASTDYPQWSVEALVRENPAAYLVDSESGGSVSAVDRRPGYDALSAVKHGRVYLVSGDLVARPGPRVVQGLQDMAKDLHPAAFR
jgi:iron complex transport system substrate-binding protein